MADLGNNPSDGFVPGTEPPLARRLAEVFAHLEEASAALDPDNLNRDRAEDLNFEARMAICTLMVDLGCDNVDNEYAEAVWQELYRDGPPAVMPVQTWTAPPITPAMEARLQAQTAPLRHLVEALVEHARTTDEGRQLLAELRAQQEDAAAS
jgi:hypothetical protein